MLGPMNSSAGLASSGSIALPLSTSADYSVRLAETAEDVRAAQQLRFEIFNLELDKGLDASYANGLDQDAFDAVCDHLLVFHASSGELAGTYRIQSGEVAAAGLGYYSEQEFDFSAFAPLRAGLIELGRGCVHRRHRNISALGLLWKAIALYAQARRARYLIGCSSLATSVPAEGWSVYSRLARTHLSPPERRTVPMPGWECPLAGAGASGLSIPKLMLAYLTLGAEICGPPAWDRQFGTIDFLTLLDLETLHPAAKRRFFG